MTQSAAPTLTEVTTLAGTAHAHPLYPPDAPLIRVSGQPEPDGRLTVVLHVDGKTWIARPCDEALHG
jgi:hypothetical protein